MIVALIKSARPAQWLKNLILFAALIFAGEMMYANNALKALAAFSIFCFLSSGLYLFNDLIDKDKDKKHPIKKFRPIASGELSDVVVAASIFILFGCGLTGAWFLNEVFFIVTSVFVLFNLLYTIFLKYIVIIDVMSIAFSFVLRAYAGAVVISVPTSKWLLINTFLLALFLGFGKRRHELTLLEDNAENHRKILDRYSPYLLDQLIGVVTASVVVMYMLYTFSPEVSSKLHTENLFLTIPFVVYGIFRYLYLIHKEEKGGSPTKVMISDSPILATVILWILTVIMVLYIL